MLLAYAVYSIHVIYAANAVNATEGRGGQREVSAKHNVQYKTDTVA